MIKNRQSFWNNKNVLVTGHSGFKGSWLCFFLKKFGASVYGYSKSKYNKNTFSELTKNDALKNYIYGDILNQTKLNNFFNISKPKIVFHLAAQSIVSRSYKKKKETFETNVIGTVNVIEACIKHKVNVLIITTTDKVYENSEKKLFFNEKHYLEGDDPYSCSKVCVEHLAKMYSKNLQQDDLKIITVRAGNVIGGGDWGEDRLIPDMLRSFLNKKIFEVRNKNSIRPWQHVLDICNGYTILAEKAYKNKFIYKTYNFGPIEKKNLKVKEVIKLVQEFFTIKIRNRKKTFKEKKVLNLSSNRVKKHLGWSNVLKQENAIKLTCDWYLEAMTNKRNIINYTNQQLKNFLKQL